MDEEKGDPVKIKTHRPAKAYTPKNDEEEDEFVARIRRTGCFAEHEAMQDCYFDSKDWRKCRDEMRKFKECFAKHEKERG
ncbi:hypothetical protein HDU96_002121 [Phlyctochytrium bullatum]|nr:hypothetical protein HDU96_002121 [Phlyctochytrium bullatum]